MMHAPTPMVEQKWQPCASGQASVPTRSICTFYSTFYALQYYIYFTHTVGILSMRALVYLQVLSVNPNDLVVEAPTVTSVSTVETTEGSNSDGDTDRTPLWLIVVLTITVTGVVVGLGVFFWQRHTYRASRHYGPDSHSGFHSPVITTDVDDNNTNHHHVTRGSGGGFVDKVSMDDDHDDDDHDLPGQATREVVPLRRPVPAAAFSPRKDHDLSIV